MPISNCPWSAKSQLATRIKWPLYETDFFEDLPREKEEFLNLAVERRFRKHAYVFIEGELSSSVFYVVEGRVKVFMTTSFGEEAIIFICGPGTIFGLCEGIERKERKSSAQALTSVRLLEAKAHDFEFLLSRHFSLVKRTLEVLTRRIRYLSTQALYLAACDTRTKLARFLVYLACCDLDGLDKQYSLKKSAFFSLELTQQEIAWGIGTTRQTVNKTLQDMEREGLIQVSRNNITLLKPLELIALINF